MAEPRSAWGIDIGQSALKAIKVRFQENSSQVIAEAFDYIPFPKILSQPDAIAEEIVPQAMQTFLSRNDLKGEVVAIGVPGQSALARFIQLPPVESSKLHEIVKYEARQQIPFALEEVIWDYQPLGAGSEEGGFLLDAEVGLFAMKRDQINQQLRPYNNAKVEVELIQIAPLALYNVLSFDELGIRRDSAGEPGTDYFIVLDMGCDNTTLMVSNGYKIWIRNVPIGGNHFTRALTKEMKLSFAKAEHLKCNATKSPDPRAVFQALRPVFNDYVSEIQRSIGYFSSVNRAAKVVKVIGLGNGFKLAGLQKFLQQNLQYEVERPDTYKALTGDAVLNSPLFAENVLSFAVPYGLALQALNVTRIRTSLLPPEITSARRIRRKKPWLIASAAALLAGLMLSTAGNAFSYSMVSPARFGDAEKEVDLFTKEISNYDTAYKTEKTKFAGINGRLNSVTQGRRRSGRADFLEVYTAVVDCLPFETGETPSVEQLEKKNLICLTEFTADHVDDLGGWFQSLNETQKSYMTADDKAKPPAGPGYVITLRGEHWHDAGELEFDDRSTQYVVNQFLKKLQQPTVQRTDFPRRDVRRQGITHATIREAEEKKESISLGQRAQGTPSRLDKSKAPGGPAGPGGFPMGGMNAPPMLQNFPGAYPPGGAQPAAGNSKQVSHTKFVIQFAYKYVAPGARPAEAPAGTPAPGGPPPAAAAPASTPAKPPGKPLET